MYTSVNISLAALVIGSLYMLTVQRELGYWAAGLEFSLAVVALFQGAQLPTFGFCMMFLMALGLIFDGGDRIVETWVKDKEDENEYE